MRSVQDLGDADGQARTAGDQHHLICRLGDDGKILVIEGVEDDIPETGLLDTLQLRPHRTHSRTHRLMEDVAGAPPALPLHEAGELGLPHRCDGVVAHR